MNAQKTTEVVKKSTLKKMLGDKVFIISLTIVIIIMIMAIFAPLIAPYGIDDMNVKNRLSVPVFVPGGSVKHILGTDGLGRDLFTRILYGLRNSMLIAFFSVSIIFGIGIIVGLFSGLSGKNIDNIVMTLTDIQLSLPIIVVAVILLAVARPTILTITVVLGICGWPAYARSTRASVLAEKSKDYILAAEIMGAKTLWVLKKYFFKSVVLRTLSFVVLEFGLMIIWEALLSFMGIGIQPPNVSLGTIMGDGINYLVNAWWITTLPGVFIAIITISLNFLSRRIVAIVNTENN